VPENRVLWRLFGTLREEATRIEKTIMRTFIIFMLHQNFHNMDGGEHKLVQNYDLKTLEYMGD
jgi:hypothetical protein